MNCDGSGWIGVGVGRTTYAQKCPGCLNCKGPSKLETPLKKIAIAKDSTPGTVPFTSGLQCPRCLQWFPGPGVHHAVEGSHVVPHVLEAPNESNSDSAN